ncbi:urea transport system ATP-binding protein [Anaerocolumna jejuensis DSM 15929]|uniref:Urea transport system ATP-binding protein n=1 Tax=Anaerocolumna jejuensis DSM 15929 TaxID=1121322 RepID=A0A1M6TAD5_9FIRM|nr:ATP-binding cassette domain-containing protein [Anaerocolumna jejuensis]SHK53927.1 urea transport system ATP-binding protein [Anaerocolumna jejuensis DSM 15929]
MFIAENVQVSYGKSRVINGLSLHVKEGSRTAILGRNGVGKTTFLKSAIGILPISSGSLRFNGEDITKRKTFKRSEAGLGYVPQGREIIPMLTVKENLELGALGHKGIHIDSRMEWVLEYFPALKVHMSRNGGVLSGGLQQQLALARCLMGKPRMMLLDEPTEGIQPNVVIEIADTLKKIAVETGITIAVVEQNLKFARRLADNYVIMQKGIIVSEGRMIDLSEDVIKQYLSV